MSPHDRHHQRNSVWSLLFLGMTICSFILLVQSRTVLAEELQSFEEVAQTLTAKSYKKKQKAVIALGELDDPRVGKVFKELLAKRLYFLSETKELVSITPEGQKFAVQSINTGESLGLKSKNQLKQVRTNNKIRTLLKSELAKRNLGSSDAQIRLVAAKEMFSKLSPKTIPLFREREKIETDDQVKSYLKVGLAIADIEVAKDQDLMKAIKTLGGSLHPEAKTGLVKKLADLEKKALSGEEASYEIKAIKSALKRINEKRSFFQFTETVFFGLSLGSVLLLAAIGLAITFGVMGVINMAHGELIMLGAYTTYFIQSLFPGLIDFSIFMAIPAAFIVSGLFGIAIERGVIRHLYGRPLETLLATFGISLILQQLVRTTISAQNVIVSTPSWMSGSLQINPIFSITFNRAYIIVFSLMVFLALLYILHKTVLGLQIRAVSQNRSMAKAMGVRSNWVDALTFGLGSGIAGIAGVALSQLTNVGPNMGQAYIIDSFMVVVFGGVGNLWGTLVGALSLGVLNKFLEPWAGAVMAKILVLIFIILFIQKKPRGLFPKKGRFAEE
jgi:urea transport system permease protein